MRFLKTLVNNLLGTKKEYEVEGLGTFFCKVYDRWQKERYIWWSEVQMPIYSGVTVIVLEGDTSAPFTRQLSDLKVLLEDWKLLTACLDRMLLDESRMADKEELYAFWQEQFYPEAINPSIQDNEGWEITFVRTDDQDDYFSFVWKNNTVHDLTLE